MNLQDFRWVGVPRLELPSLLFKYQVSVIEFFASPEACIKLSGIAVGLDSDLLKQGYAVPRLIVLADEVMAETLSWLRTFAPEAFPISQFGRVLSFSDCVSFFEKGKKRGAKTKNILNRSYRWASIVLGELLSQTEGATKLGSLAYGHASSCFSMSFAKAQLLHDADKVRDTCADRLHLFQDDRRFAKRTLSLNDLFPIWSLLEMTVPENANPVEVVEWALARMAGFVTTKAVRGNSIAALMGAESGLLSDSVEDRVKAFQKLLIRLNAEYGERFDPMPNLLVAAGAFLVGRSTTHVFLLQRVKDKWPVAMAWFGMLAAVGGQEIWDGEWSRVTRGVERVLRIGMDDRATAADLSWAEYAWLRHVFEGEDAFSDFPKMQSKMLSVEIVPGAVCQLRIASGSSNQPIDAERAYVSEMEQRIRALESVVENFVILGTQSRKLLEHKHLAQEPIRPKEQGNLYFDEMDAARYKSAKKYVVGPEQFVS